MVSTQECAHCGYKRGDLAHLLRGCPAMAAHRRPVEAFLELSPLGVLPRALALRSTAPALSA
eukprot:14917985-Alexandrium_andersonii.AAC.1